MTDKTQDSDTVIRELVVDEAYKQKALDQVKKMVSGNKFNPDDIKVEKFEGEVLHFQAENMLTILVKTSHKKVAGRIEGAIVVDNEAAAKDAITKAYLSLSKDKDLERQIRDAILKREDGGFGVDNNKVPLPFWKKEFVYFEQCLTCDAKGNVRCSRCAGRGITQCPRCNGIGTNNCEHCNGAQTILGPNGGQLPCPICNGIGRSACQSCNRSGKIKCKICRSKGSTTCPNCQGSIWTSNIEIMEIEARTAFDYPKDKLPEKVVAMIEKHGAKIREHADITLSQAQQQAGIDDNKDYKIPVIYEVLLPYGHIEYNINNKSYYTFLFGKKGRLSYVSPFLDDLLKNGIRKLHDAAERRGDITQNIAQAAQYRTLKEGILYTAKHSLGKAKNKLKQTNSLGLSNSAIKDIITQIDLAFKNITDKPRKIGLALSGLFNAALFATYFMSPARAIITSYLPNDNLFMLSDLTVLLIAIYIGVLIIQTTAHSAVKKVMNLIGIKKSATPKLGDKIYWNAGLCIVIFTAMMELSRQISANTPDWYMSLFL